MQPFSFLWFAIWRFVAGASGAVLVVVGPSLALQYTNIHHRRIVATMTFMGIGTGIVLSAVLMPYLLSFGLPVTWLILGAMSLLAIPGTLVGIRKMVANPVTHANDSSSQVSSTRNHLPRQANSHAVWLIMIAYCFDAAGFIPHTVFWVDYLERELGIAPDIALSQWTLLGCGALVGPWIANIWIRRLGWHYALVVAYLLKTLAIAGGAISHALWWLCLSSFGVGMMIPAVVSLTSGYLMEITGIPSHKKVWGQATAGFAMIQALAGLLMSYFYDQVGRYAPLFPIAAGLMAIGMVLVWLSRGHNSEITQVSDHSGEKP
jgi:predicted MFS family arabinose efflux permease